MLRQARVPTEHALARNGPVQGFHISKNEDRCQEFCKGESDSTLRRQPWKSRSPQRQHRRPGSCASHPTPWQPLDPEDPGTRQLAGIQAVGKHCLLEIGHTRQASLKCFYQGTTVSDRFCPRPQAGRASFPVKVRNKNVSMM